MIHLPTRVRVYLCTAPCDMRRSFDGLDALVTAVLELDAFAGHLFVFANRRFEWFRDVLSRVADHSIRQLDQLLPHAWEAVRA